MDDVDHANQRLTSVYAVRAPAELRSIQPKRGYEVSPGNLVVTEIDPSTGSWAEDYAVDLTTQFSQAQIVKLLANNRIVRPRSRSHARITALVGKKLRDLVVRKRSLVEQSVSYVLHTNRELSLMLSDSKDLAVFAMHASEIECEIIGQRFAKYSSRIGRKDISLGETRYVFFFSPNAEWKVNAYMINELCARRLGPSRHTEFTTGILLGYTPEQNIEYLNNFWSKFRDA